MTVVFADIVIVIVIMHARMIQSDAVISCCGDASKAKQSNRYLIRVRAFCSFFFSFFFLFYNFIFLVRECVTPKAQSIHKQRERIRLYCYNKTKEENNASWIH